MVTGASCPPALARCLLRKRPKPENGAVGAHPGRAACTVVVLRFAQKDPVLLCGPRPLLVYWLCLDDLVRYRQFLSLVLRGARAWWARSRSSGDGGGVGDDGDGIVFPPLVIMQLCIVFKGFTPRAGHDLDHLDNLNRHLRSRSSTVDPLYFPLGDVVQDLYTKYVASNSTDPAQEICARSYRSYGSHPVT